MVQLIPFLIQPTRNLSHYQSHSLKLQIVTLLPSQHILPNQSSSSIKKTTIMPFTFQLPLHQSLCPLHHQILYIQNHLLQPLFTSRPPQRSQFTNLLQPSQLTIHQSQQSQPTNHHQQLSHHTIHLQHRSHPMLHQSLHMLHQSQYTSPSLVTSPHLQNKHTMNHHHSHPTILLSSHIRNHSKPHTSSMQDIPQFISINSLQF